MHCGRVFSVEEIAGIRQTVAWLPRLGRRELAATLCEHLQRYTVTAKAHACREFLERLEAAGLVVLPPLQVARRPRPAPLAPVVAPPAPLHGPLAALGPVRLAPVRADAAAVAQWNAAVARWHPLGYKGAFGYRLRYFITGGEQHLGCLLLAGAARALAVRDHWIGWDAQTRRANQVRVLNNSRFLIFPHVQVPHLASHVLGQLARPARRVSRSVWRECRCVRCGVQDSGTWGYRLRSSPPTWHRWS